MNGEKILVLNYYDLIEFWMHKLVQILQFNMDNNSDVLISIVTSAKISINEFFLIVLQLIWYNSKCMPNSLKKIWG